MTRDEIINECLDLEAVRAIPGANVVGLSWRHYSDWQRIPSLQVRLILDESLTDCQVEDLPMMEIVDLFLQRLLKAGIELFPFVQVAKQSELTEALAK